MDNLTPLPPTFGRLGDNDPSSAAHDRKRWVDDDDDDDDEIAYFTVRWKTSYFVYRTKNMK